MSDFFDILFPLLEKGILLTYVPYEEEEEKKHPSRNSCIFLKLYCYSRKAFINMTVIYEECYEYNQYI